MAAAAASDATPLSTASAILDGLDVPALHAHADALVRQHNAAEVGDGDAFAAFLRAKLRTEKEQAEYQRQQDVIARRMALGRIREVDGRALDILYALGGPIAELRADGRCREANVIANRYFDLSPQGAAGWSLLPLATALNSSSTTQSNAALSSGPTRLLAIGGLSGSGKSSLARLIADRVGRAPGARVLRSDVFRKRLAGLPPESRLPPEHYSRSSDQETYEALFESADDHIGCGNSVILDSVFASRSERDVAAAIAFRARIPFTGIWLDAPEADRLNRVTSRTGDASDASEEVVRHQSRYSIGELGNWYRIRANRPIQTIIAAVRAALDHGAKW